MARSLTGVSAPTFSPRIVRPDGDRKNVTGSASTPYLAAAAASGSNAIGYGTWYLAANALAGARESAESMPTNATVPCSARAALTSAGVSLVQTRQVEDQKFTTIGRPASPDRVTGP